MSEQDTREQLEAELRDELRLVFGGNGGQRYASYKFVQSLLDRQAAITEREVKERVDFSLTTQIADALFPYYQERIAELTAEVKNQRQRANDAERGVLSNEWYVARDRYEDDVAELTAERDQLREALDACGTGTMYELWRKDHAQLEAIRAALHDKPGT